MFTYPSAAWVKRVVSSCLLIPTLLIVGCLRNPQKFVKSGEKYISEGKYDQAVLELRNAIRVDPTNAEAHYQLAIVYAAAAQFSRSETELTRVVTIQPGNSDAQLMFGNVLLFQARFDEARAKADALLATSPKDTRAEILSANSYAGIIGFNESIGELRLVYNVEPRLAPSYLHLSARSGFRAQPQVAEDGYRKAIADDPQSAIAHLALANFYLQTDRISEAEPEFNKATTLAPDSYDAKSSLAFFYVKAHKLDLAEKAYVELANTKTAGANGHIVLADFYAQSGNPTKSIEVLEQIGHDFPGNAPARRRLANLYFELKQFDKASQAADDAIKKDPANLDAHVIKGSILLAQNKPNEAVTEFQNVLKAGGHFRRRAIFLRWRISS